MRNLVENSCNNLARIYNSLKPSIFARQKSEQSGEDGRWHSWDSHPWKHPWLTSKNLRKMKQFSSEFIEKEKKALEHVDPRNLKIGFVGNIANCMYLRAKYLRRVGLSVDIFLHPQDRYIMSYPFWEEFDGILPLGVTNFSECRKAGIEFPKVEGVFQIDDDINWREKNLDEDYSFIRKDDLQAFPSYMSNLPTLKALQNYDVLWSTQCVYLGYLAKRPYVVSQMGGDIWFEASRGDELGRLQRRAFSCGRVFLTSNPWSFAHARRFGFDNLVYLPLVLDQEVYKPGHGKTRQQWIDESGGDFFVLTSSRLDERSKGSSIGLRGFAEFSKTHPGARLVTVGWGKNAEEYLAALQKWGIADKIIILPISGKERLRDALRSADIFIDQFVLGYYGSAGMEAMACGLPVIGRIETEQYDAICETGAPPIHNANTIGKVARLLTDLADNAEMRQISSKAHRDWFLVNHGAAYWYDAYVAVLAATSLGRSADYSQSPLRKPLSYREILYHAKGLASSPPYPHYGW